MKLVEIIPNANTAQEYIDQVQEFAEDVLGKGVVVANDVPGFVANRVGTQTMNDIMYRAESSGLSITEVDALTGKSIGRPKMGTYGLSDLVGLDIAKAVIGGLQKSQKNNRISMIQKLLINYMKMVRLVIRRNKAFIKRKANDA